MKDKRKYPRFGCPNNRFCSYRFKGEKDFSGNVMNVSREGITFSSLKSLRKNSVINLNLVYLDMNQEIFSTVEIVWSHRGKIIHIHGARFIKIQPEDKADLLDFCYEDWKKRLLAERR